MNLIYQFGHTQIERETVRLPGRSWGLILGRPESPRRRRGGLFQVEMAQKDWARRNLCFVHELQRWPSHVFVSASLSSLLLPLSVTCKWQRDSVITFDMPPFCFLRGPDNCYGNKMLPRSFDRLSRAASRLDESFDPVSLFRSVLVGLLWWHVCKLRVSYITVTNHVTLKMKRS